MRLESKFRFADEWRIGFDGRTGRQNEQHVSVAAPAAEPQVAADMLPVAPAGGSSTTPSPFPVEAEPDAPSPPPVVPAASALSPPNPVAPASDGFVPASDASPPAPVVPALGALPNPAAAADTATPMATDSSEPEPPAADDDAPLASPMSPADDAQPSSLPASTFGDYALLASQAGATFAEIDRLYSDLINDFQGPLIKSLRLMRKNDAIMQDIEATMQDDAPVVSQSDETEVDDGVAGEGEPAALVFPPAPTPVSSPAPTLALPPAAVSVVASVAPSEEQDFRQGDRVRVAATTTHVTTSLGRRGIAGKFGLRRREEKGLGHCPARRPSRKRRSGPQVPARTRR